MEKRENWTETEAVSNETLIAAAKAMMAFSYAPFSHYCVGAALFGSDGKIYTGCNVESAAFSATLCAERCAIGKAVSAGCRSFRKLAVIATGESYCTPCGVCRQMLWEFSEDMTVLCCRNDGTYLECTIAELLPYGFRAANMEV